MTITFEGRAPHPRYAFIGMDGEHNAETLTLEGLPEHEGKTVVLNIILPNGTADALAVTDGQVTITRNTTLPGTATAWVSILDGTSYVWKSEKILLRVGQLPDIDTPIEQQYPGIVEQAVEAIEEAGQLIGGVPAGGTTGQVLAKKSGADYDTEWQTVQGGGLPSGGNTFQVLSKTSNADGAADWRDVRELPSGGGNAQQFLISDWGQNFWEYLAYILNLAQEQGTGDKIVEINEVELWNVYYSGRPIRLYDEAEATDNLWTLSGMYEDRDGDGLPVFLMEYKRLKNDFTWETMKMRAASEDGSYIARIVT